jgi:hypothetical protein
MRHFNSASIIFLSIGLGSLAAGCSGGGGGGLIGLLTSHPSSTPTPAPTPDEVTEAAQRSDALVDSIGINTHLGRSNSPYTASNFAALNSLLTGLGIRHARDQAFAPGNNAALCSEESSLAASGIKFDYYADPDVPTSTLSSWTACVGTALEAYEGPNEYDIEHPSSDTNWPSTLSSYQQSLYAAVKGNAASASIPVIAPSLTTSSAYNAVGDLSSVVDYGNTHMGFSGYNPGTSGFGPGGYGSIAYRLSGSAVEAGSRPVMATEAGYTTAALADGVNLAVQAKYVPRLVIEMFLAGLPRTYLYELTDEPEDTGLTGSFGLATSSLAPKPAYTALQSLISLLAEPSQTFTPATVSFVLTGASADVRHAIFEKTDGSLYIAFWREDEGWNPTTETAIAVSPVSIGIRLNTAPSAITEYTYNAAYALAPQTLTPSASLTLSVTDSVQILHIVPAASTSAHARK